MRALLFAVGVFALLDSTGAADNDPVKEKLDKAKSAYDQQLDKLRAGVLKSLADREGTARKMSNKALVDQIKAERDAFEARGELPKSVPTANYLRDAKQARTALELAYTVAIKEYVKTRKDDEAATAEKDLTALKDSTGATGTSLSALLNPDTVWLGVRRVATAKGKLVEDPFALKVAGRERKNFKGEIVLDGTRRYDVEGVVVGDAIAFATEKKGKFKQTFEGRLRGGSLELIRGGTGQGGDRVKGAVILTPPKKK